MLSKKEILLKLSDIKPYLQKEYAVKSIGLFGSYALMLNSHDSDIDILVEFERPVGWKMLTLEIYLESIFKRKIDLVTQNALKSQIKEHILKQVQYV
jgi:hypothetical protein